MSRKPDLDPQCLRSPAEGSIAHVIDARQRDLGGFFVRRLLPSAARRQVGPFVFFDHMGPAQFAPSAGLDVPPHPHIGLATVTYLFDGEIHHRDSLGSSQRVRPGAVNWMVAGRGIAHSERTPPELRRRGSSLHGLQLWVALPASDEECDPSFDHHPADSLPGLELGGAHLRVLAGAAYGVASPVRTPSPLFYVDARMPAKCELALPDEHAERALYVVEGAIGCGPQRAETGRMLVFTPDESVVLRAESSARIVLLGGAPLDGPRKIEWNFVASSAERIGKAKRDWREGRFAKVKGDEIEFVPLP